MEDKRTFTVDEKKYYVNAPTADDIRGADWTYSKLFTKSLMEGITTSAEMQDILRRRGIIGVDYDSRVAELQADLQALILDLSIESDMDKKQVLAQQVSEARDSLFQWNQRLNGPMSNTCEQMSDDARLEYLTSRMVVDENNELVWKTYENFLEENDNSLAIRARYNIMLYIQGLDEDFLDNTPEAIAIKEINESKDNATVIPVDKDKEKVKKKDK